MLATTKARTVTVRAFALCQCLLVVTWRCVVDAVERLLRPPG